MLMMTRRFMDPWAELDRNGATAPSEWTPSCDVLEEKDELKLVLELPGVRPEDLKITLENRTLAISGQKKQAAFERKFTLPNTVDTDRIQAKTEHGVLTLTLPKAEQAKPRAIAVQS